MYRLVQLPQLSSHYCLTPSVYYLFKMSRDRSLVCLSFGKLGWNNRPEIILYLLISNGSQSIIDRYTNSSTTTKTNFDWSDTSLKLSLNNVHLETAIMKTVSMVNQKSNICYQQTSTQLFLTWHRNVRFFSFPSHISQTIIVVAYL